MIKYEIPEVFVKWTKYIDGQKFDYQLR